jgi:capsular exopolysaccharide synthesis family protein
MAIWNSIKVNRARIWMVIVAAAIVSATSVVVSFLQTPVYEGEATVLLTQQNAGTTLLGAPQPQLSNQPEREVQTQIDVMRSRGIVAKVIGTLDLATTPTDLLEHVNVSANGETNIVTIAVTDRSAARAAEIANALANGYVGWSRDFQRGSIQAAINDVQERLASAQQQIVAIETSPSGGSSAAKQVKLQSAQNLYATLSDKLEQLKINQRLATGSGSVLARAGVDTVPVSPKPVRDGAIGLAMGLLLGLGLAFAATKLDNTIKSADEAEDIYGAPVLGDIPLSEFKEDGTSRLTLVQHPGGHAAETYRVLRNNLEFINVERDIKTVLITSAAPSEGKSTVAANLATVLSQAGKTVVLVNCDFHRPTTTTFFDVNDWIGLSDVLAGTQDVSAALQEPEGFERLRILPAGSIPPNPSALLSSTAMGNLIAKLRQSADWIILDSAPLLAVADAAALARWVDGALVVARVGVSTRDAALKSREQLGRVGARVLGVVLWGLEDSAVHGGYSYKGYTSD